MAVLSELLSGSRSCKSRKSRNFGTFNFSATARLPYGLPPLLANALSGRRKRVGWHPTLSREEIL